MSLSISSRTAGGSQRLQHFESDDAGQEVLDSILEALRAAGHTVTRDGDVYTATDRNGELVQRVQVSRA